MILICGLGNPGYEYSNTRHNIGFSFIDYLAKSMLGDSFSYKSKFNSDLVSHVFNEEKIILAKPQTYMNNSGHSVVQISHFYKIKAENIIVIHDELDLPYGKIKTKFSGSNAGHNGLKDIDNKIGDNYHRIRIGIDHPRNLENKAIKVSDYVLQNFSKEQQSSLNDVYIEAEEKLVNILLTISL